MHKKSIITRLNHGFNRLCKNSAIYVRFRAKSGQNIDDFVFLYRYIYNLNDIKSVPYNLINMQKNIIKTNVN